MVKANPQSAKAYAEILRMVTSREIQPGRPIAVPELAKQLSMSVTPVREAIRKLELEGLLEVVPRRGTFARNFELTDLIVGYELAESLEGMAAFLVAERIQDGALNARDLSPLTDLATAMEGCLSKNNATNWSKLDTEFHGAIIDLCGNKLLQANWRNVKTQMDCVLWFITPLHVDRNLSTREHKVIVKTLRSGDPGEARRISQAHKHRVRDTLVDLVNSSK